MGKGALIVSGQHNIDHKGRWIEDELFNYLGDIKLHRKGKNARRALEQWVKQKGSSSFDGAL